MRKVRQCPTTLATMECPRPGGMISTVKSWLHLIVTVELEKMGRLCKKVCLSLPALAHRYPLSRLSMRHQSWPCRFNSLGIWVVGLDPHPTLGPFCDGPELRHKTSLPTYQMLGRFCRWIKMQNCHVRRTDVVNLYIRWLCSHQVPNGFLSGSQMFLKFPMHFLTRSQ